MNGIGGEEPGYGLYSYAILVKHSDRSIEFLYDVFDIIDPAKSLATPHSRLNLLSVPSRTTELLDSGHSRAYFFEKHFYNYEMAKTLLDHICDPPVEEVKVLCEAGLTKGPYIFTFAQPASKLTAVRPPFLIVDLSPFDDRAFPEIIDAFSAQVKREDFSDRAKIDTLSLTVLKFALKIDKSLWVTQKAVADIIHVVGERAERDKK